MYSKRSTPNSDFTFAFFLGCQTVAYQILRQSKQAPHKTGKVKIKSEAGRDRIKLKRLSIRAEHATETLLMSVTFNARDAKASFSV